MKRHPKLRVTLAHYGFTGKRIDQAKRFLDDYEFTAFDTTPACSHISPSRKTPTPGETFCNLTHTKSNMAQTP